jgi:hypothetical protein
MWEWSRDETRLGYSVHVLLNYTSLSHDNLFFIPLFLPPSLPPSLRAADTIDRCLSQLLKYVEDMQAGKVPSNPRVGRLLMESVSRVPKIDNTRFEAMLNSTMQVLALVLVLCVFS